MEFKSIYLVSTGNARGSLHVDPRNADQLDPYAIAKGRFPQDQVLEFDSFSGSRPVDYVGTTLPPLCLISDSLRLLLEKHRFTGWCAAPARVVNKDGAEISGYNIFGVIGRCGKIDDTLSTEVWRTPPSESHERIRTLLGVYFDPSTWDGSDIFGPAKSGLMFVLERVKEAIVDAEMSNIAFTPVADVERLWKT
jgi:hypothetical protein